MGRAIGPLVGRGAALPLLQFCWSAAGGSRKLSAVQFVLSAGLEIVELPNTSEPWVDGTRWVASGSRLLPTRRTAVLLSGSPPEHRQQPPQPRPS
jgi:hypothetical protein